MSHETLKPEYKFILVSVPKMPKKSKCIAEPAAASTPGKAEALQPPASQTRRQSLGALSVGTLANAQLLAHTVEANCRLLLLVVDNPDDAQRLTRKQLGDFSTCELIT